MLTKSRGWLKRKTQRPDDPNLYLIPLVEVFILQADGKSFELRVNYPKHAMRIIPGAADAVAIAHVIVAWWGAYYDYHRTPCPLVEIFPDAFQARPGWDVYYGSCTTPLTVAAP